MTIKYYDTIDSTNEEGKRLAREGVKEALLIAETQTAGKGRMGRTFYSPKATGLYMTMLLPIRSVKGYFENISLRVSVGVYRAILEKFGIDLSIKWVNDLYLNDKKVCGILIESVPDVLVIGIGLNLETSDFPEDIKEIATSLFSRDSEKKFQDVESRKSLAETISNAVIQELKDPSDEWRNLYESRLLWKNEMIHFGEVLKGGTFVLEGDGCILNVDEKGGLHIETSTKKKVLRTGEISIRKNEIP